MISATSPNQEGVAGTDSRSGLDTAQSRDLFGNNQMSFIGTAKVSTDALGQLVSRKQAIGLDHIALGVDPFGLNWVEPGVSNALRLRCERRNTACRIQERREPGEPQHRPAVKPLEAMLCDGFGDKAHGRQCKRGAGQVGLGCGIQPILERGPSGPLFDFAGKERA